MDLSKFVEVGTNYEPIRISSSQNTLNEVINTFTQKTIQGKIVGASQISRVNLDGKNSILFHLYVGSMDQVVFAYSFENIDNDVEISLRVFEKANIVGKALWGITRNVFAGVPRTLDLEINLLKNTGKLAKGLTTKSPLGNESNESAMTYLNLIHKHLLESIELYK